MSPSFALRRLTLDDMDNAALVHRAAFDDRQPWLLYRWDKPADRLPTP